MEPDMRASWREWLVLRLGRKGSRQRTILNLGAQDNFQRRRIRLLVLALRDRDAELRERAAEALYSLTRRLHRGMALLSGALMTPAEIVAEVEVMMREGGATKALVACLTDEVWDVRRDAAEALGEMRAHDAVEQLIKVAQGDADWHVTEQAACALGKIGDTRAVDVLVKVLSSTTHHSEASQGYWHPDRAVRLSCVHALSDLGDPRALPALEAALADSGNDNEMERAARHAVSRVGPKDSHKALASTSPLEA
jgi:HEAT repeat protein